VSVKVSSDVLEEPLGVIFGDHVPDDDHARLAERR
jgi:hypothetical protein